MFLALIGWITGLTPPESNGRTLKSYKNFGKVFQTWTHEKFYILFEYTLYIHDIYVIMMREKKKT